MAIQASLSHDQQIEKLQREWKYPTRGNIEAPVVVLCEPPDIEAAKQSMPMSMELMKLFARMAADAGMVQNDFVFVGLCPPIPLALANSESKKWSFVQDYQEGALNLIRHINPNFVVTMGKLPARVMSGRAMAVNKARGQFYKSKEMDTPFFAMLSAKLVGMQPDYRPIMAADMSTLKRVKEAGWDKRVLDVSKADYHWTFDLQHLIDNPPASIAIDTETTGLQTQASDFKVLIVQITHKTGHTDVVRVCPDYFPDHPIFNTQTQDDLVRVRQQIKELCENPNITKILHNGKYDFKALRTMGIEMNDWWDTELMARFVNENFLQYNLDEMVRIYVPEMAGYADKFNETVDKGQMIKVPPEDILDDHGKVVQHGMLSYAGGDSDATFRLAKALKPRLSSDRANLHVMNKIHRRALFALTKSMETYGFTIDEVALQEFQDDLEEWITNETRALIRMTPAAVRRHYLSDPKGFKFSRDDVMRDILFKPMDPAKKSLGFGLVPKVFTKGTMDDPDPTKRVPSVSTKDHLPYFITEKGVAGEFVVRYSELKKATKMLDTYAKGFWKYIQTGHNGERKIIPEYNFRTNTKRSNCLHGDTLIQTNRGDVPISNIEVGDTVLSHTGKERAVTGVFKKPVDRMYKVSLSNGQNFLCSLGHMILTENGWSSVFDVIFQSHYKQRQSVPRSSSVIPQGNQHYGADSRVTQTQHEQCPLNHHEKRDTSRKETNKKHTLPSQQNWGEKSPVWENTVELHRTVRGWLRILNRSGGWNTILCPSGSYGASLGPTSERFTEQHGGSPHRREHWQQPHKQSGATNQNGTRRDTSSYQLGVEITGISQVGFFPVYDIAVDIDKSYSACGIIHHNSSNPNGQNFPKRGKFAKPFRRLFKASRGKVLVASDLSQAELRIAAWMANEPAMLQVYRDDGDIHATTAALTMGISVEEFYELDHSIKKTKRQGAKAVNFGLIYGAREQTFITYAKTTYNVDYSMREATIIRDRYFSTYAGLLPWHERMKAEAAEFGAVRSLHGLTRHLHAMYSNDWSIKSGAERNAINSPVQNFGSDLGIIAFLRLAAQADPHLIRPVGFIHDQLIAEVDENYVAEGMGWLRWVMENPPLEDWFGIRSPIPIKSDPEWGLNLADTTELADDEEMLQRVAPHVAKPDWWNDDEEEVWDVYRQSASVPPHVIRNMVTNG